MAHYRQIRSKSGSLSSGAGGSLSPASYAHFGPAKVVYYVRRFHYIHGDEVEVITNAFNGIMEHSLNQLDFMEQVLSNDFLNMSDAERLEILEGQREASQRMLAAVKLKKRRYDMVISFRKMQTLINDRKLNY